MVAFALLLGSPGFILFGWLSDKVGRKPIMKIHDAWICTRRSHILPHLLGKSIVFLPFHTKKFLNGKETFENSRSSDELRKGKERIVIIVYFLLGIGA
jgi:MFS family permease